MHKFTLFGQQSDRLLFREVTEKDFPIWLQFFKDPRATQYWPMASTPEAECRATFDKIFHRYANDLGGMNALTEKQSGEFIGLCGLLIQTVDDIEELEIGYSVLPKFWKRGYATEAARKCKEVAFAHQYRDSLISIIHKNNVPSQKVAMNNGMKLDKQTVYKEIPVHIYRIKDVL